jgi:hypothetical protein
VLVRIVRFHRVVTFLVTRSLNFGRLAEKYDAELLRNGRSLSSIWQSFSAQPPSSLAQRRDLLRRRTYVPFTRERPQGRLTTKSILSGRVDEYSRERNSHAPRERSRPVISSIKGPRGGSQGIVRRSARQLFISPCSTRNNPA